MLKKKKSLIHGYGMFAAGVIAKNKKVIQYTGEKISAKECRRRDKIYKRRGELWTFWINRNWAVDAHVGGNNARFINHADKPNCWIDIRKGEIWYRASRTIRRGEELTVDYGVELPGSPKRLHGKRRKR